MTSFRYMSPMVDVVFQHVFAAPERRRLLIALIDDLLELGGPHRVLEVEVPYYLLHYEAPHPALTVQCKDGLGNKFAVVVQLLAGEPLGLCALKEVGQRYPRRVERGEMFPRDGDAIGLHICDFELWPYSERVQVPMLSRWVAAPGVPGSDRGSEQHQHVFLELPKRDPEAPPFRPADKWAFFFSEIDRRDDPPKELRPEPFCTAVKTCDRLEMPLVVRFEAIHRSRILRDANGAIRDACERGRRQELLATIRLLCRMYRIDWDSRLERQVFLRNPDQLTKLRDGIVAGGKWPLDPDNLFDDFFER